MLLRIDVDPKNILLNENGHIIIKLDYYSAFAQAARLAVTDGHTIEEFYKNKIKKEKYLYVGNLGSLSLE